MKTPTILGRSIEDVIKSGCPLHIEGMKMIMVMTTPDDDN